MSVVRRRSKLTERDTVTEIVRHFVTLFFFFFTFRRELHEKTDVTLMSEWWADETLQPGDVLINIKTGNRTKLEL